MKAQTLTPGEQTVSRTFQFLKNTPAWLGTAAIALVISVLLHGYGMVSDLNDVKKRVGVIEQHYVPDTIQSERSQRETERFASIDQRLTSIEHDIRELRELFMGRTPRPSSTPRLENDSVYRHAVIRSAKRNDVSNKAGD